MTIGLFSRCAGANATLAAMKRPPGAFGGVRCIVSPQPLTIRIVFETLLQALGASASYMEDVDR